MADRTESESNSSAVDRKEAKSIEERPLLSEIGTDVDKDLSTTLNHKENDKANAEDCEVEERVPDTKNGQINGKSASDTEDTKELTTNSKEDDKTSDSKEKSESTTKDMTLMDDLVNKSGRDWDGELLRKGYVPTPRPKLLATRTPHYEPPPGAKFYKEPSWHAILEIEYEDPFEKIKLFNLTGVEKRPVTLKDVPAEYRPYEGCIFVSMYCCCKATIIVNYGIPVY